MREAVLPRPSPESHREPQRSIPSRESCPEGRKHPTSTIMADKQNSSHKTLDHIMDKFLARMQSRRNERNDSRHPSPERRRSGWIRRVRSTVCIPSPSSTLPDGPTRPAAAPTAQPLRSNIPPSMTSSNLRPDQFRRPIPPRRPAQLRRPVQLRPLPSTRPLATSTRLLPPGPVPFSPAPQNTRQPSSASSPTPLPPQSSLPPTQSSSTPASPTPPLAPHMTSSSPISSAAPPTPAPKSPAHPRFTTSPPAPPSTSPGT